MQTIIDLSPHQCADDMISVTVREPEKQHRAVLGGCVLELYNKAMRARLLARFASLDDIIDLGYAIVREANRLKTPSAPLIDPTADPFIEPPLSDDEVEAMFGANNVGKLSGACGVDGTISRENS